MKRNPAAKPPFRSSGSYELWLSAHTARRSATPRSSLGVFAACSLMLQVLRGPRVRQQSRCRSALHPVYSALLGPEVEIGGNRSVEHCAV